MRAVLLLGVPLTSHAALADVYVSETGNDITGDGSSDAAYRTLTFSLTQAMANGTVHAGPGLYQAGEIFPLELPGTVTLESPSGPWYTEIHGDNLHPVVSIARPLAQPETVVACCCCVAVSPAVRTAVQSALGS